MRAEPGLIGERALAGGAGILVVIRPGTFFEALTELLAGLAHGASELREFGATEKEKNDEEDNE